MAGTIGASLMQQSAMGGIANMAARQGAGGGQAPVQFEEKQRYCGEQVPLEKPALNELRQRVQGMNQQEIVKLQSQQNELKDLYF